MLKGILLDIDGTLLLSNQAHADAWSEAYREFGRTIRGDEVVPFIGMGGDKLMAELTPDLYEETGTGKQVTERRKAIFMERYAPHLKPSPGARALVQHIKDSGLVPVIATSAKSEELEKLLKAATLDDLLQNDHKTTSDDAKESKPAPDIVQAALEKSQLGPDEVLMIGDTQYDIQSAGKAGVGVIALRTGGHSDEDLCKALAIYSDPADLLAHWQDSPIGQTLSPETLSTAM